MPAKNTRRILKSGSTKTVALPPDWLRALKLGLGDPVDVFYDSIVLVVPKDSEIDVDYVTKELSILMARRDNQSV